MCRYLLIFHVNVTLQYQQSKQGFWNARTFLTWSLKFLALVNSVPQIVHEKLSGLFECCCLKWYCIVSFLPKVKGHCGHCTWCSKVPHRFICRKKCRLFNSFPQVGQGRGYVILGMIKICNYSRKFNSLLSYAITPSGFGNDVIGACLGKSNLWRHDSRSSWINVITNLNSLPGECSCASNQL